VSYTCGKPGRHQAGELLGPCPRPTGPAPGGYCRPIWRSRPSPRTRSRRPRATLLVSLEKASAKNLTPRMWFCTTKRGALWHAEAVFGQYLADDPLCLLNPRMQMGGWGWGPESKNRLKPGIPSGLGDGCPCRADGRATDLLHCTIPRSNSAGESTGWIARNRFRMYGSAYGYSVNKAAPRRSR
jgi:hypothetical protein